MPIYLGHKNFKGLSVSPLLQSKGIDLLRASPWSVRAIAKPLIKQPGYSSYVSFLPAFMKATNERKVIALNRSGYTTQFDIDECIDIINPPLVVDYNGPVPSKYVESLDKIGFERIKINKNENILQFPVVSIEEVREIRKTNPNSKTPSPQNTVNLEAFDSWVLFKRTISLLLQTHVYPAFRDDGHFQSEVMEAVSEIVLKREADSAVGEPPSKKARIDPSIERMETDEPEEYDEENTETIQEKPTDIPLSKAKPVYTSEEFWGKTDTVPNSSGLFFPYISELTSPDHETVPHLFEQYLFQSLGDVAERQLDRMDKLRSAWGLISRTESGNIAAHLCKVILLAIHSQSRVYPILQDEVYEGCVLLGGRFWIGINGVISRPLPFEKLQDELGDFSTHARTLQEISNIAGLSKVQTESATSMRRLRNMLLTRKIKEDERDMIRRLAVHLHFKERFLGVNSFSLTKIMNELSVPEDGEDTDLPMHHSALFSNDKILVTLSAFGYQAPSFMIENCPKIGLKGDPPVTLVMRQKPLDIATRDWKDMIESKEVRNNPRNLSRANRDRSLVGNDKKNTWSKLIELGTRAGASEDPFFVDTEGGGVLIDDDGLDNW